MAGDQRPPLDGVDQELVTALVHDARLTYQELARHVHMSANAAADRVRRLRQSGVLSGYHATIDLPAVGYHMGALSDVKLRDEIEREDFETDLEQLPQILEAIHTTGEYDYQLRLACTGTLDLEWVVDSLRELGCREVHSRIILGRRPYDPVRVLRGRDPALRVVRTPSLHR